MSSQMRSADVVCSDIIEHIASATYVRGDEMYLQILRLW